MSPSRTALLLAALLVTGCPPPPAPPDGGDGGTLDGGADGGADAGEPDAGHEALLDWREVRGPALHLDVTAELPGEPIALTEDGFVTRVCGDGGACTWRWQDRTGALRLERPALLEVQGGITRPDGRRVSLLRLERTGECVVEGSWRHATFSGAWQVLNVATGALELEVPDVTTERFLEPAFLERGGHVRFLPLDGCDQARPLVREATAPYGIPAAVGALPDDAWIDAELPDGRLLVSVWPSGVGVLSPREAASFEPLSGDVTRVAVAGRSVHVFEDYPLRAVRTLDTQRGVTSTAALPFDERDWFDRDASERYATVCSFPDAHDEVPCLLIDGDTGARTPFRTARGAGRNTTALAGRAGFLVYRSPSGEGYVRRELETGAETALPLPLARLLSVGDGLAVLAWTSDTAWLIEREAVRQVPGTLVGLSHAGRPGRGDTAQGQLVFLHTVDATGGRTSLFAWHVPSGRLTWLTESAWFVPPFDAPFTAAGDCGAPGFVRRSGPPGESATQGVTLLHFTEFVPAEQPKLRLFVMPVDLSAAPRLVAELDPGRCGAPLASLDGDALWLPVPTVNGVRGVIAH